MGLVLALLHIVFIYLPQLLFKCSVMWSLNFFIFFFSFLSFCTKITHQERLLDKMRMPLAGSKVVHLKQEMRLFLKKDLPNRRNVKRRLKFLRTKKQNKLYSPCTSLLLRDHLAPSSLDAPFGFIGSNSENICCVQSEC